MSKKCSQNHPRCGNCLSSWWNMNAIEENGWCYQCFTSPKGKCKQFDPVRKPPKRKRINKKHGVCLESNIAAQNMQRASFHIQELRGALLALISACEGDMGNVVEMIESAEKLLDDPAPNFAEFKHKQEGAFVR
jgi:hypothetical protein